jgi:hypothetical protein
VAGAPPGELRFLVDASLGRLARWLRVIGVDTECATPRHATPRHATPRHAMPCHATRDVSGADQGSEGLIRTQQCGGTDESGRSMDRCDCVPGVAMRSLLVLNS